MRSRWVMLGWLPVLAACGPRPPSPVDPLPLVAGAAPAAATAPSDAMPSVPEPEEPPATGTEPPPPGGRDRASLFPPPAEECPLGDPGPLADEAARLVVPCAGRAPCTVEWRCDAGHATDGAALVVLRLAVPSDPELEFECHAFEYWLLPAAAEGPPEMLLRVCNDGYGASGIGEDTVVVGDNRLVHSTYGGSAWRWATSREVRLVPRELLAESSGGWWNLGANTEQHSWSWETLSGSREWYSPPCDEQGEPLQEEEPALYCASYVPQFQLDAAFVRDGWRETALGECGVRVAADGSGGFLLGGTAGEVGDAALTVAAAPGPVLFVELRDDELRDGADGDRLELWLIDRMFETDYMNPCLPPVAIPPPRWWVFGATDGRLFEGERDGAPQVKVVRGGEAGAHWARLRIRLPASTAALAVVFSDVDDGGVVERTLSTVRLDRDDPGPLGPLYPIPGEHAGCAVEDGRLAPFRHPPDEPVSP
ncbi:MAG: hypothetical protein JXB32_19240 [Deltaproteobacteria bacterium]|nr:hypothetical protein [Deltaproteobacteria bacterium]